MGLFFECAPNKAEALGIIKAATYLVFELEKHEFNPGALKDEDFAKFEHCLNDIVFRAVKIFRRLPGQKETFFKLVPYGDRTGLLFGPVKEEFLRRD